MNGIARGQGTTVAFLDGFHQGSEAECWAWQARRVPDGYGSFRVEGKLVSAHRYSYEYFIGPIPEGHVVRHKCDNPPCVNPAHLETGTQRDNVHDCIARNRKFVKLTEGQVLEVRAAVAAGPRGTRAALARHYHVSPSLISMIASGNRRETLG